MFEKRRNESLGSGQRTMYNPNDGDERGSNQNQHYGDSDDDDNNISDDQDESLQ